MSSITIIGTGLTGYNLAKEIRTLDAQIPITLITSNGGEYYHKPQLSTGMTKFPHPPDLVMATAQDMASKFNLNILTHAYIEHIDTENKLLIMSEKRLSYEKLVLAVGATPIKALFNQADSEHVTSVNHLDDYLVFREKIHGTSSVTIIGAGLVGCEFADDLASAGYHVNVIAPSLTPLDTLLPAEVGLKLQEILAKKGVVWHLGQTVVDISCHQKHCVLMLSDGKTLTTEHVLTAIGIQPNVALAQKSGIHTNKGIVVNAYLQTNVEDIFALGDCAEVNGMVLPYIAPMQHCVKSLAKILCDDITPVHYPHMPIVVKTPSLPMVVLPPPRGTEGDWEVTSDGEHMAALLYEKGELKGFVLTGGRIRERMEWMKQLS